MIEQLHFHFSLLCIGEGNGNPLHGQRSLAGYSPWDHKRIGHDSATKPQQPKREAENVSLTDVTPHGN